MNLSFLNTPFKARLIFFTVFSVISICYYKEMVFFMPKGIHEWAQADRLALAMNFYDNGMNFFKPSTYSLYSINGITGVEFPIQSYLSALSGFIIGRQNIPFAFRMIDIIISLAGLYFLFLTCYSKTKNIVLSLFPPLFIFCAPVFIYYTCNFLPDTAALSFTFISYYYLFRFTDSHDIKYLIPSILWMSFATLVKTSAGIYLIALLAHAFSYMFYQRHIFKTKNFIKVGLLSLSAISFIIAYFFYNRYLNDTYHSGSFLATIMPIKERELFRYLIEDRILKIWIYEYLVHPQYYVLFLLAINGIGLMLWNFRSNFFYLAHLAMATIGAGIVFLLMDAQFIDHDYYALCIFYPLIAFILLTSLIQIGIRLPDRIRPIVNLNLIVIACVLFNRAYHHHTYRLSDTYPGFSDDYRHFWMEEGARKLEKAKIGKDAKIVILGEYAPNLGLTYFDRKGVHCTTKAREFNPASFKDFMHQYGADYVVTSNEYYDSLLAVNPGGFDSFTMISKDPLCVIMKK
jgi:hypothetical protein